MDPEDPIFSAVECFRKSLISFFANRYLTILETLATKASSSLSASPRSVKGGVAVLDFSSGFYKAWESRTQWIPLKQIFDMHDQDLREVQEKIKGLLV